MEDRDERIRIAVALSLCKGIGPVRMVQIYKAFADQWERLPFVPTPELGLPARTEMELSRTGWNALLDKAETSLHKSFLSGIRVHWVEDRLFPERLGPDRLPDGPLVLYTKGGCANPARAAHLGGGWHAKTLELWLGVHGNLGSRR